MKMIKSFSLIRTGSPFLPDVYIICDNPAVKSFEVIAFPEPIDIFLSLEFYDSDQDDSVSLLPFTQAEDARYTSLVPVVNPLDDVLVFLVSPN